MEYLVIWEIEINAENPKEAAEQALEIQRDSGSETVCFTVIELASKKETNIDLNE